MTDARSSRTLALVLTGAIAALILLLTLSPPPETPGTSGRDKIYHAAAFAALVLPLALTRGMRLVPLLGGALLFGIAIEIVQPGFGRSFELADIAADAAGALAGAAAGRALAGAWRRRRAER